MTFPLKHDIKACLLLAIIILSAACTTQKRRSDLSPLGKFYHNTTAKYNGWFNANEIMKATFAQLETQHQNNYNKVLAIYPYLENDNPQSVAPQLDTAIKKVSVVVNLHRYSEWTDDCYLLVGEAQYLKKDYESAEATFKYMLNEFDAEGHEVGKRTKSKSSLAKASPAEKKLAQKEREQTAKEKKREQERLRKEREKRVKQQRLERKRYNKAVQKARKKGKPLPPRPYARPGEDNKETPAVKPEDTKDKNKKADDKKPEAKPEPEGPQSYFLKHRPVYQDAKLWLAKTLIERDKIDEAQRIINDLNNDAATFDLIRRELPPLQAYLYLQQNHKDLAISPLSQAIDLADRRIDKARYAFILAQLYQLAGNNEAAYTNFEKVLKYTNDYELEFNARMNMAQNAWASGHGSAGDAVANLNKMLKDEKNTEYKDQIYYALGNIALKNGDRPTAIENFELSLENSVNNNSQKIETGLTLANLYYEDNDFVPAKKYFDVTLQAMPTTDPRRKEIERLSNNLTDIAKNIETIQLQDSLLRISKMSDAEKKALVAQIKEQREQESQAAQDKNAKNNAAQPRAVSTPALQKESSFFAYNDRNVKQGKREFQRKWGNRPLTDNWRLSGQQTAISQEPTDTSSTAKAVAKVSDQEVDNVLQGVPKTEADITVANIKIQEALFTLGKLYRDRLQNNGKAIEALEELNRRYPGNNEELDSWYYLYLAHKDLNHTAKAQEYADKIVAKYENSTYAKVIKDPSYIVQAQNEEHKLTEYYNEAYAAFTKGNYQFAYEQSTSAREKFGATNALQPKFALLSAMSVGNLKGKNDYISALNEVVAKYPNTEEQKYAREVLRLLGSNASTLPGGQKIEADQFEVQDDQVHSVIIALEDAGALNDCRNAVSDFNKKYHDLEKLRISDVILVNGDKRTPLIVIRRFKDKADAMRYLDGAQKNAKDFIPAKYKYQIYAITQTNYGKLFATVKDIDTYRAFFEANYR